MKVLWSFALLVYLNPLVAQFTGGIDDGYSLNQSLSFTSIFHGGSEDGYNHNEFNNFTSIYSGGLFDGYARGDYFSNFSLYKGGTEDGYARGEYESAISIYKGGTEDGYSQGYFSIGITPLTVDCPTDPNLPSDLNENSIQMAYNDWFDGFSVNGGCTGVTSNIGEIPSLPNFTIGAAINLNFTLSANNSCEPSPITCSSTFTVEGACPADFDGNGKINGVDFGIFLGNFGLMCTGCPTDLNADGVTNGLDFSVFLGNFELDCP